jgi:hypothetical protein
MAAKKSGNHNAFLIHHQKMMRTSNDIYIESSLVVQALGSVKVADKAVRLSVPSTALMRTRVDRTPKQIRSIIGRERNRREFEKAIILIVSVVEDYLFSYAKLILRAHPLRILTSIKGGEGKMAVDLAELLNHGAEHIVEECIQSRLQGALYASPQEYTHYLNRIVGAPLRQEVLERYFEAKASRDIIIHSLSIANVRYLEKAGRLARAKSGALLPMDGKYFDEVVRTAKRLAVSVYRIAVAKYSDDDKVAAALRAKGI